jgi:3,4-dihydroxy 2-butanone 4-phosphate synthase/GTP cyclohydrolase II
VGYRDWTNGYEHLALVHGDPTATDRVPVHVHTECLSGDVFGSLVCDCGTQLQRALELIVDNGVGVVIYLRDGGHNLSLQCTPAGQRLDDVDAQIVADLGLNPDTVALLTDPLVAPTGGKADIHRACSETFGGDQLSRVLPRHDNPADRQRALLHTVLTTGRRRPGKVQL